VNAAAAGVGVGLRQPHYAAVLEEGPPLAFVEVHSENFFADGGAALAVLARARERYPVSLHGVGLGLGSAAGLDPWHVERLQRLADRIDPVHVSDHASFARVPHRGGALHAADLLPVARTRAALDILCANVARVQDRLRRPLLVENVSAYVGYADDAWPEPAFFEQLCRRSGCGLLLDLNNLFVNALNDGTGGAPLDDSSRRARAFGAARDWIDATRPERVGEIHLAGYAQTPTLAIDDHGSRVRAEVWRLLEHALERFGPRPILIEWDTDLPPLPVLLDEAGEAARRVGTHRARRAALA
jgi:uncharacterized protein (UPF0276 family)